MAEEAARPRLGRGLAALIGDFPDDPRSSVDKAQQSVAVEFLRPNPRNPRRRFTEAEMAELAASIKARGIIQPILVRPLDGVPGTYEIIAGERRWRAAQNAGLTEVPVVVVPIDERTSLEYAILENVQRSDLNAIEEAAGYERLMREFTYSQKDLADILGKSRSHLSNMLRLLQLPLLVQERVSNDEISAGHARALLSVRDPEGIARRIVAEALSVREVEALAASEAASAEAPRPGRPRKAAQRFSGHCPLEHALARVFHLKVTLRKKVSGEGEICIRFGSKEELDALCERLDVKVEP